MCPPWGSLYAGDFVQVWSKDINQSHKGSWKEERHSSQNPPRTFGSYTLDYRLELLSHAGWAQVWLNYNWRIISVVIGHYHNWMAWPYYSTCIHPSRKNGQSDTKCLLEKPFPSCAGECWFLITLRWHLWGDITISVLHLDTPLKNLHILTPGCFNIF